MGKGLDLPRVGDVGASPPVSRCFMCLCKQILALILEVKSRSFPDLFIASAEERDLGAVGTRLKVRCATGTRKAKRIGELIPASFRYFSGNPRAMCIPNLGKKGIYVKRFACEDAC